MSIIEDNMRKVGRYYVGDYPPYPFWRPEYLNAASKAVKIPFNPEVPLGFYVHIPFCRSRCHFCYFNTFNDKNRSDVGRYLRALIREAEIYGRERIMRNRTIETVYFGGGTPSFLEVNELRFFFKRLGEVLSWRSAKEITFECEPGTVTRAKVRVLRAYGVTRISLGVQNFNDIILKKNGRAHDAAQIFRTYKWIKQAGFRQVNVDLIAGLIGETENNWRECIEKVIKLKPDSVTIYQMELPYNTVGYLKLRKQDRDFAVLSDWPERRALADDAYKRLKTAGFFRASAYTMVRNRKAAQYIGNSFNYGADIIGVGVAALSHLGGVNYQNTGDWDKYLDSLRSGRLPWARAFALSKKQQVIRELILRLKLGRIKIDYFRESYNVDITEMFAPVFRRWGRAGIIRANKGSIILKDDALPKIDLLSLEFFEQKYLDKPDYFCFKINP